MKVTSIPAYITQQVTTQFSLSQCQVSRAEGILLSGQIWRLPNGNLQVMSQSRQNKLHQVNARLGECNCEHGMARVMSPEKSIGVCSHVAAWLILQELPLRLIELDTPDPIAIREAVAKLSRPVKKIEWEEELV